MLGAVGKDRRAFHSSGPELQTLGNAGHPFFRPRWSPIIIGMVLDDGVDWDEVEELITESYCVQAPKKLVALVDRPPADAAGYVVCNPDIDV